MTVSLESLEQVKKAAGQGASVIPIEDAAVPGVELYYVVTKTASGKEDGRGVAVVGKRLPWLEGGKAMDAVVSAGVSDEALARAAIAILLDRGTLLTNGADHPGGLPPARGAHIKPPQRSGDKLVFWYFAGRPGALEVTLDTKAWTWTTRSLDNATQGAADPIELARTWLADPGQARNQQGIDKLVASCADPRAGALLVETLTANPKPSTRAMAAKALATCKAAGGAAALSTALGKDTDVEVRKAVVEALGELGDASARPALEKAAKGDADANVRSYAEWALGKLK